jgi:hypothetical protein
MRDGDVTIQLIEGRSFVPAARFRPIAGGVG